MIGRYGLADGGEIRIDGVRYRILIDRERAEQLARRAAKSRRGRATSAGLIVERVEPVSRNLSAPKPQDESGLAQWKRGWGRS